MRRPFIELLREHRVQSPAYSPLVMYLADVAFVDVPYRHEVLWREKVPPHAEWHYHGQGSLLSQERWSQKGARENSTLFQRLPRALWLSLLLGGEDADAMDVCLSHMGGARDLPSLDDPRSASPGERLGALLATFFWSDDAALATLFQALRGLDEVVDEAIDLLRRAVSGSTPAQVDATELIELRGRWLVRVADRVTTPLVFYDPTRQIPVDVDIPPGKVLHVHASARTADEALACFEHDQTIDGIDLSGVPRVSLYRLLRSPSAHRLRFLIGAALYDADQFAGLQLLHEPLSAGTLQRLGEGPCKLRALIGRGPIGPEGFAQLAKASAFSELRWVSIQSACPKDQGAIEWFRSGRTRHLRALSLVNVTVGDGVDGLKEAGMAALVDADLSELRYLDLNSNEGLNDRLATRLARNKRLGPLRHLALEGTGIQGEGVRALVKHAPLGQLEHLDLYRTPVGPEGAVAIARSGFLAQLRYLRVMSIKDKGLLALARGASFARLEVLGLERCHLTSEGLSALAQARWMHTVRSLDLQNNKIDDDGIIALAASPYFRALERLELYQNKLTTTGVRALLERLPALRRLGVGGASVTAAERQTFKTLRPEVDVGL